jgi:hypothetical protein
MDMQNVKQVARGIVWSAAVASTLAAVVLVIAYFHVMSLA